MLFPPYIAQPCKFACCRPTSTSVPRYNAATRPRRNSFTQLLPLNDSLLTPPPRPPPTVGYEPSQVYVPQQQQQQAQQSRSRQSFTLVPILKPASSMPGSNGHLLDGDGIDSVAVDNADVASSSQYHSSQPNLLSSNSNSYLYLHGNGVRAGGVASGERNAGYRGTSAAAGAAAAAAAGLVGRRAISIERRTTPYYYHELLQKNIFDSSLNLLQQEKEKDKEKEKNSNLKLEAAGLTGSNHAAMAKRAAVAMATPLAKPQQQRLPSSLAYGSYASTSNLLSNGNSNGNGNGSSAGTLVDEEGSVEQDVEPAAILRGSGQAARSLNLAFNNLSNQIANLNNLSSNNNNNHNNNADSNNNVGQNSACIA